MSDSQGFTWKIGCEIAAVGALLLAVVGCAPVATVQFVFLLIFGWIGFFLRVVPEIEWDAAAILTGLLALGIFTVGLHGFLAWLSRAHQAKGADPCESSAGLTVKPWPFLRTVHFVLLTLCLFVAGISMVGVTHQAVWLAQYPGPWLQVGGREAAYRMFSGNNLTQFGIGAHVYHDEADTLPPGMTTDEHGLPAHGWMTQLLPQLEQAALADKVRRDKPWNDPANRDVFATQLPFATTDVRGNPKEDADGYALTHYAGSADLLGSSRAWTFDQISDGLSQTVLFGETAGNYKPWGHPRNARDLRLGINQSPDGFGGPWRGKGGQFTLADGSVKYLSPKTDPRVLEALATPNANDKVGEYSPP